MTEPYNFVAPSGDEIFDIFGASVFYVLSDMPWSFSVLAGRGETVGIWVSELPDTVNINVSVKLDDIVTFTSYREAASRLAISAQAPEIIIESGSGDYVGRLEISLKPRLLIRDTVSYR